MNLRLELIDDPDRAAELLPLLERGAKESSLAFLEEEVADGAGRLFLDRHFAAKESVLVVAESDDGPMGLAATAPFVDPLSGVALPMLTILWVDPSLRHRGVARGLVREVRRRLREKGHDVLSARAAHNDDALISMGERWGLVRAWELMSSG